MYIILGGLQELDHTGLHERQAGQVSSVNGSKVERRLFVDNFLLLQGFFVYLSRYFVLFLCFMFFLADCLPMWTFVEEITMDYEVRSNAWLGNLDPKNNESLVEIVTCNDKTLTQG